MRVQALISLSLLALASPTSAAATEYLGIYMQGAKVGYASYVSSPARFRGKRATRTISVTEIAVNLMGTPVEMRIGDVTYVDHAGRPLEMTFDNTSRGRTQHVIADFAQKTAQVKVVNTGTVTYHTLQIPRGANIADDPMNGLVFGHTKIGHTNAVYILDPTTISFVKTTIVFKGKAATIVHGKSVTAEWVQIRDSRATTDVYCRANGDLVKVNAPLGFEMFPESRTRAMSHASGSANVDLAVGSKISPVGELKDPGRLRDLKLDLAVKDIDKLPSDSHQTVAKTAHGWSVWIHPPASPIPSGYTIAQAAKGHEVWTRPELNAPSRSARFVKLAKTIVGAETDIGAAAKKLQLYVYNAMQPDASIAVLRDANEVLDTRRGVCRDYAILTATLMRAAGIPTRLVTGLVSWDGDFYYHAWVAIYNGRNWVGVDSTTDEPQVSAAHVELAIGGVSEAFAAPVLQHAVVKVVSSHE